jgi:hypothetical protein
VKTIVNTVLAITYLATAFNSIAMDQTILDQVHCDLKKTLVPSEHVFEASSRPNYNAAFLVAINGEEYHLSFLEEVANYYDHAFLEVYKTEIKNYLESVFKDYIKDGRLEIEFTKLDFFGRDKDRVVVRLKFKNEQVQKALAKLYEHKLPFQKGWNLYNLGEHNKNYKPHITFGPKKDRKGNSTGAEKNAELLLKQKTFTIKTKDIYVAVQNNIPSLREDKNDSKDKIERIKIENNKRRKLREYKKEFLFK